MKRLTILATLFVFATACGSDDSSEENNSDNTNNIRTANNLNNPMPNNGATNNGATNNGATNNGATNNGATNNGATNNGVSIVWQEMEPNDDRENANTFMLGDTIAGTAEGGGEDVFAFEATAGTILELEILSIEPTIDVAFMLEPESDDVEDRGIDLATGVKRQFFLTEAGTWYFTIRCLEPNDRDYELVIREITPMPITEAFTATVAGDLNTGVDVYLLPDSNGRVEAVLEAERLASDSDLDSVMYVYSPTAGLVTYNDDAPQTTDSELDFTATAGETYWLVVDAWRVGASNPYELTVTLP